MVGRKQFEPEAALARATEFFRIKGYASASVDDLVQYIGISRGSLYATFGNKQELFLASLDQYCSTMMNRLAIDVSLPPREAMEQFFRDLVRTMTTWTPGGCLVTNICAEYGNVPAAAQARVRLALREQEHQFTDYFRAAAARGELPPGADVQELAAWFVAIRQSICLLARAGEPRKRLAAIGASSLTALDHAGPSGRGTVGAVADRSARSGRRAGSATKAEPAN